MDSTASSGPATPGPLAQRALDRLRMPGASPADSRSAPERMDVTSMLSTTAPGSPVVDFVDGSGRRNSVVTWLIVTAIVCFVVFVVYRGYQMAGSYLGMQ